MKKAYEMIIEDGMTVFKCVRPSESEKQLRSTYGGNGEFVRVKEVTKDYPINLEHLRRTLERAGYGEPEIDIIVTMVSDYAGTL